MFILFLLHMIHHNQLFNLTSYYAFHCGNNNKDEDNSPKTLNDKNYQASSQKFRQQVDMISLNEREII